MTSSCLPQGCLRYAEATYPFPLDALSSFFWHLHFQSFKVEPFWAKSRSLGEKKTIKFLRKSVPLRYFIVFSAESFFWNPQIPQIPQSSSVRGSIVSSLDPMRPPSSLAERTCPQGLHSGFARGETRGWGNWRVANWRVGLLNKHTLWLGWLLWSKKPWPLPQSLAGLKNQLESQ